MPQLRPEDNVVATYREHGQALLRGVSMNAIMARCTRNRKAAPAAAAARCICSIGPRAFSAVNAIVAGGLPLACGLALADKQLPRDNAVTACFFGEGAVAEGAFHESLNLASLWRLPVLFLCENNLYAMGTALARSESQTDLVAKAAAYRMEAAHCNGMDVLAVDTAAARAVDYVRSNARHTSSSCTPIGSARTRCSMPSCIEPRPGRGLKERGPIHTFTQRLKAANMLTEAQFLALDQAAVEEVDAAVAFAEAEAGSRSRISRRTFSRRARPQRF